MEVEAVAVGESLQQLHGALGAHLGHPIEEEGLLAGVTGDVQLTETELQGEERRGSVTRPTDREVTRGRSERSRGILQGLQGSE